MADRSTIEWTEATWNPITGCSKVSPGCAHCYAERFAERWRGIDGHPYAQGFDLKLWPERLDIPLRWRRPRRLLLEHDRRPVQSRPALLRPHGRPLDAARLNQQPARRTRLEPLHLRRRRPGQCDRPKWSTPCLVL